MTSQHQTDGREWTTDLARDGWPGQALTAQRDDLFLLMPAQTGRAAMRPGRAVGQTGGALGGMAIAPFADGLGGHAPRRGDRADRPTGCQTLDHQQSTMAGGSGILMDVHPGLRVAGCRPHNHSLSAQPRRDNLHSSAT